ncbi:hypothetical protein Glove_490g37 [Diversispora epigaea]|uniref:Uncharacterized protein n=1 Tax=Diversispora epigaea TaxID=1348612 RepID=A0A397GK34_9GLOM|nr:hypothetical protein Glove_490g37 [Diversispora epigaea]
MELEDEAFQCYLKLAEEKTFMWFLKSAEGENNSEQFGLGHCYQRGIETTKDEEKAFLWYLKSAERGNIKRLNNLGYRCQFGIGTTTDEKKGFHLGSCYHYGFGTPKDYKKAFHLYMKSAEGGDSYGQINLSYCYRNEIGILKIKKNENKLKNRCHNCEELNLQNNACPNCELIEIPKWTSGNGEIEKIIQMIQSDDNAKE